MSDSELERLRSELEARDKKIAELERKNRLLAAQVQELSQEIENVKMDFGRDR